MTRIFLKLNEESQKTLDLIDELCELACLMDKMTHLDTTEKKYREVRYEIIQRLQARE